jgi:hypothetical protein
VRASATTVGHGHVYGHVYDHVYVHDRRVMPV